MPVKLNMKETFCQHMRIYNVQSCGSGWEVDAHTLPWLLVLLIDVI